MAGHSWVCRKCGGTERYPSGPCVACMRARAYYNREHNREYARVYYEANREKILEEKRAYYQANREKMLEDKRAYRAARRECEYNRAYRAANRAKSAESYAARREYNRAYRAANRENIRAYYQANRENYRAYYQANREKLLEYSREYYVARKTKRVMHDFLVKWARLKEDFK
jgi:hypothetical protein